MGMLSFLGWMTWRAVLTREFVVRDFMKAVVHSWQEIIFVTTVCVTPWQVDLDNAHI